MGKADPADIAASFCSEPPRLRSSPMVLQKRDQDNISAKELRAFRLLADTMLNMDEAALNAAKRNGTLMEIG